MTSPSIALISSVKVTPCGKTAVVGVTPQEVKDRRIISKLAKKLK